MSGPAAVAPGERGPLDAVTDVPGVQVGQVQSAAEPYLTGVTLVYLPTLSVTGVDQRGGAPATRETDLLDPLNSNPGVNAIQLGGSSMYGLDAASGVVRWLEDRGEGIDLGEVGVAPIVPAADIYDLGRGGDVKARTTAEWGWLAADAASAGPVRQGTAGGGTGALSGTLKGGVGSASVSLGDGTMVGAIVVVNSFGAALDPETCGLLAASTSDVDIAGLRVPEASECRAEPVEDGGESLNTTIAVIATNAPLDNAAAARLAGSGQDGLARALDPIHTLYDGDTVFAVSTGEGVRLSITDPAAGPQLNAIYEAGAHVLSRAVAKAVLSAESIAGFPSYCDTYPSACEGISELESWRTAGTAPDVTEETFEKASDRLGVAPIPGH